MAEATVVKGTEDARDFHHCISDLPYRALVFTRLDGMGKALYVVGGCAEPESGAKRALERAAKKHGASCFYCPQTKLQTFTVDHVEPVASGGSDTLQNLVISCQPCNAAKSHKPIEVFNPRAGRAWLTAVHKQIEDRLAKLA